MKILLLLTLFIMTDAATLFDFQPTTDASSWRIVDDGVMGGRSDGHFTVTEAGHGRFYGHVSLENNGGFSSLRHDFAQSRQFTDRKTFVLRLKGDGKKYQFRVQPTGQGYSYIYEFATSGEWETLEVPFGDLHAAYRGRQLDRPDYAGGRVQGMAFLIGNKKEQDFELLLDEIAVR